MCVECNNRSEEEKPWLQQRKITFNHGHDWLHTMVLQVQAVAKSEPIKQSIDERLVKLEAKLEARLAKQEEESRSFEAKLEARLDRQEEENRSFESTVSVRLQKMEELLERVLIAVTPAT
jgi:arginyl-tRNA synthetase